jgi:hypothetical protein
MENALLVMVNVRMMKSVVKDVTALSRVLKWDMVDNVLTQFVEVTDTIKTYL